MWNTGKNFFVSEPILIRFGVQMYLGDILAHTKSYQDWLRIGCAGQISILLHKLLWCSISLLWKNDIFWHLDWFFEIFGNELQIFLHGWLEGLQGFHLERVWLHENFYFLVRKCLDFREENLKNNSSPFFSNMVRARAFNLSRPLIDTIKPYNFYCEHFWLRSFHSYISSVPLLLWEFRLTVRHCIGYIFAAQKVFTLLFRLTYLPGMTKTRSLL